MAYYSLSVCPPAENSSPAWREAHRLSRLIPNPPHPERAAAVHAWARAVLRALRCCHESR